MNFAPLNLKTWLRAWKLIDEVSRNDAFDG